MKMNQDTPKKQEAEKFDREKIIAQLKRWCEKLLDLSKGNPLLGINRSRVSKVKIEEPLQSELFKKLVINNERLKCPLVEWKKKPEKDDNKVPLLEVPTDDEKTKYILKSGDITLAAEPKDLFRLLKRIYDNGRLTIEERGVTTLHVTFGLLNWEDPILGKSISPILLVPCQLESRGASSHLVLSMLDEEIQINPSLELYLRERHHFTLPIFPDEPTEDSLDKYLEEIRIGVKEKGWNIEEQSWLSTFSFESLSLYKDLQKMTELACTNPLIASFAHAGHIPELSESLGDNLDELPTPEVVPIPVMTADASQLKALTKAVMGKNLVVHGPPGTGKSQTITNLIADALGRGQRVLFVSAKMAALNVVYERLAKLGLGRFCLEAHSTKAGKAQIIEELKRTLESPTNGDPKTFESELEELRRIRQQLNTYVREIHLRRDPLGETVYEAIGKVEVLEKIPTVEFELPWSELLSVNRDQLREKTEKLEQFSAMAGIFDKQASHPWRGFVIKQDQKIDAENIKKNLQKILTNSQLIIKHLEEVGDLIKPVKEYRKLSKLSELLPILKALSECDQLPNQWMSKGIEGLKKFEGLFSEAADKGEKFDTLSKELAKVSPLTPKEFGKLLEPINSKYSSWTRVVKPDYWKFRAKMRKQLIGSSSSSFSDLKSYRQKTLILDKIGSWFEAHDSDISKFIKDPLNKYEELKKIVTRLKTAVLLRQAIASNIIEYPNKGASISSSLRDAADSLGKAITNNDYIDAIKEIDPLWSNGFSDDSNLESLDLSVAVGRCEEIIAGANKLHEWRALQLIIDKCREAGLEDLINNLHLLGASNAPLIFKKRFYSKWAEEVLESSPILQEHSSSQYQEKVEHFQEIDLKLQKLTLRQIIANASEAAVPVIQAQSKFGNYSEIGILRRELQKRKRFKPLRKLFNEIPHVLQAIKPCMLMSPISVSTFLQPDNIKFDLVVFDEASQLPTQEAIPSILRGKQIVVAGDENQLPPTTFFLASSLFEEDEDSEEDLEPLESLLDDCVAISPVFDEARIVWHYRSKDERLIKFSNYYFYNNQLITFPSSSLSTEGRGVRLEYSPEGVWDKGKSRTNRVEAQRVAKTVIEQLTKFPDRSIGVVSMNISQKEAIELALDELVKNKPKLQPLLDANSDFFVKSLENIQGDERDTIIISVGYAKTSSGALSLNFGPLNRDGGWRRLNVLITRAKWQTILVTSLRSHELDAVNPANRGAVMLRNFIEYTEKESQLPLEPLVISEYETNDFEDSIATSLRERGVVVDEQVGASGYRIDLAVRDKRDQDRYLLGIECDGATYHSAKTARDRDLLREDVLRSQGWKMYRVWSTDWFRDPEGQLEGILQYIKKALHSSSTESMPAPKRSEKSSNIEDNDEVQILSNESKSKKVRKYQPGRSYEKLKTTRNYDEHILMNSNNMWKLKETIKEVVNKEFPIHKDLLIDRLKEVFQVSRAGTNIRANVNGALNLLHKYDNFVIKNDFVYGTEKNNIIGFRTPTAEETRDMEKIPPEEIENAILYLVEDQFGFSKDRLPKTIHELFGLSRVDPGSSNKIISLAENLVDKKILRINGFTLYLE